MGRMADISAAMDGGSLNNTTVAGEWSSGSECRKAGTVPEMRKKGGGVARRTATTWAHEADYGSAIIMRGLAGRQKSSANNNRHSGSKIEETSAKMVNAEAVFAAYAHHHQ